MAALAYDPIIHPGPWVGMTNPVKWYIPALPKIWLILIAGLAWSSIGLFLNLTAFTWLPHLSNSTTPILIGIGLLLALVIGFLGFSLLAEEEYPAHPKAPR